MANKKKFIYYLTTTKILSDDSMIFHRELDTSLGRSYETEEEKNLVIDFVKEQMKIDRVFCKEMKRENDYLYCDLEDINGDWRKWTINLKNRDLFVQYSGGSIRYSHIKVRR